MRGIQIYSDIALTISRYIGDKVCVKILEHAHLFPELDSQGSNYLQSIDIKLSKDNDEVKVDKVTQKEPGPLYKEFGLSPECGYSYVLHVPIKKFLNAQNPLKTYLWIIFNFLKELFTKYDVHVDYLDKVFIEAEGQILKDEKCKKEFNEDVEMLS